MCKSGHQLSTPCACIPELVYSLSPSLITSVCLAFTRFFCAEDDFELLIHHNYTLRPCKPPAHFSRNGHFFLIALPPLPSET